MLSRGLLGSVLVLLGGLVVSTLPRSAPILEVEALADLRGAELLAAQGIRQRLDRAGLEHVLSHEDEELEALKLSASEQEMLQALGYFGDE